MKNEKINIKERYSSKKHEDYKIKDQEVATSFNRFLAFLVDLFFTIVLGIFLTWLIFQPTLGFAKQETKVQEKLRIIETKSAYTKLYLFEDNVITSEEDYFKEYYNYQQYIVYGIGNKDDLKLNADPIYFYYKTYQGYSISKVNQEILKLSSSLQNAYYTTSSLDEEAYLKEDVLISCSNVIYSNSSISNEDKALYNQFSNYLMDIIKDARKNFEDGSEYKKIIGDYQKEVEDLAIISSHAGMIAYSISAVFFYLLVPVVNKKQTIGQKIFKLKLVFIDYANVSFFDLLSRFILMIPVLFWGIGFMGIASFGFKTIFLPFIKIGSNYITYYVPMLVSLVLSILCFIVIVFSKNHCAYYDNTFNNILISTNGKQIGKDVKNEKK